MLTLMQVDNEVCVVTLYGLVLGYECSGGAF